jgi:hypothetical protein
VGFEPALYPDVASLWFPDLGQLHNAAAAGTFEWVVAEGGFDALAPLEVLAGLSQGLQVEEGDLKAKCIKGSADGRVNLAFDVASVEAGIAYGLHSLRME